MYVLLPASFVIAVLLGYVSCDLVVATTTDGYQYTNTSMTQTQFSQSPQSTFLSTGDTVVITTAHNDATMTQSSLATITQSSVPYSSTRGTANNSNTTTSPGTTWNSTSTNHTTESSVTVTTHTQTPGDNEPVGGPLGTAAVVGIIVGSVAFLLLIAALLYMIRRCYDNDLFVNKSSHEQPFSITMEFWDDKFGSNYLNGHIELPKDTTDEMMQSLDNDSFLNSLENITYQNYQSFQTINTKV